MTDSDLMPFLAVFKSLRMIFPLRGEEQEIQDMGGSFFKALRRYPLDAVKAGADAYALRGKKFPKPFEWIEAIPKQRASREALAQLTPAERSDYLRAETSRYRGEDPCTCDACRAAGVDHRFPRYVPEFDRDDHECRALIGEREVVRGHWAHGEELRRWYAAHDAFWAEFGTALERKSMAKTKRAKVPFAHRLELIYAKKQRTPAPERL